MERKIGEIFEHNGEWYQCVEQPEKYDKTVCAICDFHGIGNCELDKCSGTYRSDKKSVIFKKLEKVGAPYIIGNKLIQRYKMYPTTYHINVYGWYYHNLDVKSWTIDIEIKQNKEDMEEKKQCGDTRFRIIARAKEHLFQATNIAEDKKELEVLDSFLLRCWQMGWLKQYEDAEEKKLNLKPFDIQKEREVKPVCTRDGRKARIIAFDANGGRPIVALVTECDDEEEIPYKYHCDGFYNCQSIPSDNDLMMLPERKEGWAKVRKDINLYDTKEEADRKMIGNDEYVTAKVCWEE